MGGAFPLLKPLQAGNSGRLASALYKAFYQFYVQQQDPILARDIHKLVFRLYFFYIEVFISLWTILIDFKLSLPGAY